MKKIFFIIFMTFVFLIIHSYAQEPEQESGILTQDTLNEEARDNSGLEGKIEGQNQDESQNQGVTGDQSEPDEQESSEKEEDEDQSEDPCDADPEVCAGGACHYDSTKMDCVGSCIGGKSCDIVGTSKCKCQ